MCPIVIHVQLSCYTDCNLLSQTVNPHIQDIIRYITIGRSKEISDQSKSTSTPHSLHCPNNPLGPAESSRVDSNRSLGKFASLRIMPAPIFAAYSTI